MSNFSTELVGRVRDRLTDDVLAQAHHRLHRKAIVVVGWYITSYVGVLLANNWWVGSLACVSLALSMGAVGFNIQHDANHNAFFSTCGSRRLTTANRIAGLSINAIGGSSKRWIDGHVRQHHVSPNIVGKDYDIELAPFARLAPGQKHHGWHAFQHLYVWVVYGFTSVSIIVGDVVNTVQESFSREPNKTPTFVDYLVLVGSKGLFLVIMVVVPLFLHPWWVVLVGSIAVMAISGFVLGIVFQLAHVVEEADFGIASERADVRWHEWQVLSSVDFCHGDRPVARAVTWFAGGLNYQTEHHLFPELPHTVYPAIAPIVAETCAEFGVRHHVQPSLRAALRSHYRHVRLLGKPDSVASDVDIAADA